MHDAIIIGAGPNGLTAAATLARQGWKVLLLEAQSRPGGAVYSLELTLPGYLHDVGAAFFPFANDGPAFSQLNLTGAGLEWRNAPWESCHPAPDGSCASISRDVDRTAAAFGPDGDAWRRLAAWGRRMGERLPKVLLAALPGFGPAWRLGVRNVIRLGLAGIQSTGGFARRHFHTETARRVIPAMGLHVDFGPNDWGGTGLGLVLALGAASPGFRIPVGGARAITQALLRRLEQAGGALQIDRRVQAIVVRDKRAVAVMTEDGEEIPFRHAVVADVGAPALYLKMLPSERVPSWVRWSMRRFRYAWGTFKMDWALAGRVPWKREEARSAAVVHAGDSVADLTAFTEQVRAGHLPENPYLVIGQQSLVDPSRAPPGRHTLWAYSRVPSSLDGGWPAHKERFADLIERRIEGLAPGFRQSIQARAIHAPDDLERMDENLVGGDLGGGSAHLRQQLFFRPLFPYFRYRTPVHGVYLASASAHPGAGVHGACGYNAACAALRDAQRKGYIG
jgi:phytoene dehydrogenase-like protein